MAKRSTFVGAIVALLASISFQLSPGLASAAPKIVISFAGMNPRQTPLWIAQEQGFFAKHGVDTDVVFIRTGPIQVAAVSSGATQIAYAGAASILGAAGSGTDLRVIASFTNKLTYALIARPEIKKAEDLRGKRFGVQAIGGSVWMGAVLGLEYLGLDPRRDNINILSIDRRHPRFVSATAGAR